MNIKYRLLFGLLFAFLVVSGLPSPDIRQHSPADQGTFPAPEQAACTAFCLDNGDHCIFGTNQDNTLEIGLLFVNPRHLRKSNWEPGSAGDYARWTAKYGSVTINFTGYQMVWSGMNEAGLMLSTMAVAETVSPEPDERPPLLTPYWMQYQLDNHSTIQQVISSDADIRLGQPAVDHYLVCERSGACAVIEFLEGGQRVYTGDTLPVAALTNTTYQEMMPTWEASRRGERLDLNDSRQRFVTAGSRVVDFHPTSAEEAVTYAFQTLAAAARPDTVWSIVYDPVNLRMYFRTQRDPRIRHLAFADLDFSCRSAVKLLDVHAQVSGDISGDFRPYTHFQSMAHTMSFADLFEGVDLSPFEVDVLMRGIESFPCQGGSDAVQLVDLQYRPWLSPTYIWAGRALFYRIIPYWLLFAGLSLLYLVWRMAKGRLGWLDWLVPALLLGPVGLLAYLLFRWTRRAVT